MANPSKAKGTGLEREVKRAFEARGLVARRTPPGHPFDLWVDGSSRGRPIEALVTRPDRGQALVTIPLDDFAMLLRRNGNDAHVEAKRYARFAHHRLYEETFGGGK